VGCVKTVENISFPPHPILMPNAYKDEETG